MISFEEARTTILQSVSTVGVIDEELLEALGLVAAENVVAAENLPSFDNSAMDGFAVRLADLSLVVPVVGVVHAGEVAPAHLALGTTVRIMTGAPVPNGSELVIPFEDVHEVNATIRLRDGKKLRVGQHIRRAAEDVRVGDIIIPAGKLLGVAEICMLAAQGRRSILVFRRPRVAILATGDELVEPGQPLVPGKIYNSNSLALAAAVKEAGAIPVLLGIARDDRDSLSAKLTEALRADVVLTAAGVSVGDRDLVRPLLDELGVQMKVWKVNMKPGKAVAFGVLNGKCVLALPGNPVSALVVFEVFVRPALLKMMGQQRILKRTVTAVLQEKIRKMPGRLVFSRVRLERSGDVLKAWSAGNQDTGALGTMLYTDGLAILREQSESVNAGDVIEVLPLSNRID